MRKGFLGKRWTSRLGLALVAVIFVGCRDEGKGVVDTPITDAEVFDALLDADSLVVDEGVEGPLPDLGPDFGLGTPIFRLNVLHGGESGTRFRSPDGFGGVSRFIGVWDELVARVDPTMNSGLVRVSVGAHIEAGRNHAASGALGGPSLSAAAVNLAAFDAVAVSARDFALGPDVFADLVEETGSGIVFVGSNVDVSQEARLAGLADAGRVAESVVVVTGASRVGIVSVTPDLIPSYTVPGEVTLTDPLAAVQGAVDRLTGRDVDKVVLLCPTDGPWAIELLSKLHHVDIVVTAARDAVQGVDGGVLAGDDEQTGPYPIQARDATGFWVPVVSVGDDYRYVGRLVVDFDDEGQLVRVASLSAPVRVAGPLYDDPAPVSGEAEEVIMDPLAAGLAVLDEQAAGRTDVTLEGRREAIRRRETNLGDLVADAVLWAGRAEALVAGLTSPTIAVVPTSVIRVDARIPPRVIAQSDLYEWMGSGGYLALATVNRAELKLAFEHALSRLEDENGRFLQIAGLRLVWDRSGTPLTRDAAGRITHLGARVQELSMADGTVFVMGGELVEGDPVSIVAPGAMLHGADGFEFTAEPRFIPTSLGESLRGYVTGAIQGRITAEQYPEEGSGRIVAP